MSLARIVAVVLRQFYLIRGSLSRFLPLFIWVTVDILLWGFLTSYLNRITSPGFDFIPVVLGAILFWDFFIRIMQGVTMTFFEDVWSRNFINIFSTPLKISEYLLGLIFSSVTTSFVGIVIMLFLAVGVFGLSFAVYGLAVMPFLLVMFIFGIALGIIASAMVLRLGPAAEWFVWPIPAIISPFVGVFYPLSILPVWMRGFSYLLPPSYVFEAIRTLTKDQAANVGGLLLSFILALVYLLLAVAFFIRTYNYALRTGLIIRYSAENLG